MIPSVPRSVNFSLGFPAEVLICCGLADLRRIDDHLLELPMSFRTGDLLGAAWLDLREKEAVGYARFRSGG